MTDNELLIAISNIIDPLREDVQDLKEDVAVLKEDVQDIKVRVKKIELVQENEILPRLNTIESCYTATYDRYRDSVDGYETMQQDITVMKKVLTEHSERLQKIG